MIWVPPGFLCCSRRWVTKVVKCSIHVWQTREQDICTGTCRKLYQVKRPNLMELRFAAAANQTGKSQVCSLGFVEIFYQDFRNA